MAPRHALTCAPQHRAALAGVARELREMVQEIREDLQKESHRKYDSRSFVAQLLLVQESGQVARRRGGRARQRDDRRYRSAVGWWRAAGISLSAFQAATRRLRRR